jgi:hypothetical protein
MKTLIERLLSYQKPDGRFGDASLDYTASAIGPKHMALLWGNGRLLIGLLACHKRLADPRILEASRKLGDFILAVEKQCGPEVRKGSKDRARADSSASHSRSRAGRLSRVTGEKMSRGCSVRGAASWPTRHTAHTRILATLRGSD